MIPSAHLDTYARLLVEHAVGLRPDQDLYIRGSSEHDDFALRVGEAGYQIARSVRYHSVHAEHLAQLIRCGTPAQIALYWSRENAYFSEIVEKNAALISLANHHEPPEPVRQAAAANPRNHALFLQDRREALSTFYKPAKRRLFASTFAPAATPRWAKKIFPALPPGEATDQLWKLLLEISRADQPDALEINKARAAQNHARENMLNQLGIEEIHVTGGGNDLKIGLSPRARWAGCSNQTTTGQVFHVNFPCEEIFTAPDARQTEGRLVASRPLRLADGNVIENLVLEFRRGKVARIEASQGCEAITKWLATDDGARCLGEIGLVSQDSAIGKTGVCFDLVNLDENAAAHVALGQALAFNIENSETLTEPELQELGWNRSAIHTDVLFGSSEVTIRATRSKVGEVVLIDGGRWSENLPHLARAAPGPHPRLLAS